MREPLAGEADGLAGETPADEVNVLSAGVDVSDVFVDRDVRPVVSEYVPAEGLDLAHPAGLHACPLESEVESSDAGEQRSNREHVTGVRA